MDPAQHRQRCTVCSAENSEHATICASCGSFLQNRVATLDLFATFWGILEHPGRTFRLVTRAEQKNYALFLFALGGILPMMTLFFLYAMGEFLPSLLSVLPISVLSGMAVGLASAPLMGGLVAALSRAAGGDNSFRNALATSAYALCPMIVIGFITLPIQWLTFGQYQFTLNPHPETINETSYWILIALQAIAGGWSMALLWAGIRISLRINTLKAALVTGTTLAIVAGLWILLLDMTHRYLTTSEMQHIL